jgi:hypothetical protein
MKTCFKPIAASVVKGVWYCYEPDNQVVCAIYKYENGFGLEAYKVQWFISHDELLSDKFRGVWKDSRFPSFEHAKEHIIMAAPILGYKMLDEHYRTLL